MTIDEKALEDIGRRVLNGETIQGDVHFSSEDCKMLYSLGYSLYNQGRFDEACPLFRKLCTVKPLEKLHWMGLASSLQGGGHFKEASEGWSMAALLDNNDPMPHFHAAECFLSLEESEEALTALSAAQKRLRLPQDESLKDQIETLISIWKKDHE